MTSPPTVLYSHLWLIFFRLNVLIECEPKVSEVKSRNESGALGTYKTGMLQKKSTDRVRSNYKGRKKQCHNKFWAIQWYVSLHQTQSDYVNPLFFFVDKKQKQRKRAKRKFVCQRKRRGLLKYLHVWRDMWPLLLTLCFMPGILLFNSHKFHVLVIKEKKISN